MPENFRALIVILGISACVFAIAKRPICNAGLTDHSTFVRDRNTWLTVTITAFAAQNFWIFAFVTAVFVTVRASRHEHPLALYCLLLFAVPPLQREIPGIGPIDHIIAIDLNRILNICVLLPLALRLGRSSGQQSNTRILDFVVGGLLGWMFLAQALNDSLSGTARAGFYLLVDCWLPYYVASRALSTSDQFARVLTWFALASLIAGAIGVFESSRHWLLYESLRPALNVPADLPPYLTRGEGGPLRANVSFGQPIVLGYVLAISLVFFAHVSPRIAPVWRRYAALAGLVLGLVSSFSRGPWVGAGVALLIFFLAGPGLGGRLVRAAGIVGFLTLGVLISPFGEKIIAYLPFVGSVETGSIDYRERLFDVSIEVLFQNPLLGDIHFIRNPLMEQMRQGQGIIDMVNTFLQFALPYGLVGLALFCGAFLIALLRVWKSQRSCMKTSPDTERLGRALFAALCGIITIIATVSSIGVIPTVYWLVLGMAAGYVRSSSASEFQKNFPGIGLQLGPGRPNPQRSSVSARRRNM